MSSKLIIKEIVAGCLKGHVSCQRELVNRFSESLYTVCIRYIGDEHKAQDILQDSFIKIFSSIKQYDENKGNLSTWMRKITVNTALKQLDKKYLDSSNTLAVNMNEQWSIEPSVFDKLDSEYLIDMIKSLPEGYRQVFNLYVIEGYSHKEIGQLLQIREVSSRSNLSRARQMLKQKIQSQKKIESWVKIS